MMKKLLILILTVCCIYVGISIASSDRNVRLLLKINSELKFFKFKFGHYPSEKEGLGALTKLISKDEIKDFRDFKDSWGNPLVYKYPAAYSDCDFDLYSIGVNGIDEKGKGDDITNCGL